MGTLLKSAIALTCAGLLAGCGQAAMEEFAFRKTLEHRLTKLCEDDAPCVEAVKEQSGECMEHADWRTYLNDSENEKKKLVFMAGFFSCVVDSDGNPYFKTQ